jgi:site-specific DNA-methyltransferase (adenine-specific)
MKWELMEGDCLELMEDIPDESIDLIICDPPYGVVKQHWDKKIDLDKLWTEYKRIRKPYSAILIFGAEPFSTEIRMSNIKEYKYDWIWVKKNAMNFLQAANMPLRYHELISVFSDGVINHAKRSPTRMTYNPQTTKIDNPKTIQRRPFKQGERGFNGGRGGKKVVDRKDFPKMILSNFPAPRNRFNMTQKPVELYEYFINTYSFEGNTILDNCAGSGTLGEACFKTNRNAIMIEADNESCIYIKERMKGLKKSGKSI